MKYISSSFIQNKFIWFLSCICFLGINSEPVNAAESFSCLMQPKAQVNLGSPVSGLLSTLHVTHGMRVKENQIVAELTSSQQRVEIEIAKFRADSKLEIFSAQSRLKFQEAQVKRAEELYKRKVISTVKLDEQRTERVLAENAVQEAKFARSLRNLELKRANELLKLRSIKSPISGIIHEIGMQPGEYVHEQSTIMVIAQLDPLEIEVFLPVELYGEIEINQRVVIIPEAPIGGRYTASIISKDQVFDAASGTFGLRIELENKDYALPGGHRCQLFLSGASG